jgi:O-acetylserine/cysteine efflux transporter
MVLAAVTSVIWGLAFIAVKFALESFAAPQLTAVRFLVAALPVRGPGSRGRPSCSSD